MATFERPPPDLGTEGDVVLKRIVAFIIDAIIFAVSLGIVSAIFGAVSETLAGVVSALGGLLFFVYFIYFEAEYGQTLGKMVMNIVVVTEGGDPITYREAAIRTLLRIVDALPFLYLIGLIAIYFTDRKQRLGDIVADTIVVKAKQKGEQL